MGEGNVFTRVCVSVHTPGGQATYAAGGMPLAVSQEDFLVYIIMEIISGDTSIASRLLRYIYPLFDDGLYMTEMSDFCTGNLFQVRGPFLFHFHAYFRDEFSNDRLLSQFSRVGVTCTNHSDIDLGKEEKCEVQ